MRRLHAGLLLMSLLAISAGSASAQEPAQAPSPGAEASQRVVFEEPGFGVTAPGFAVTVPADWDVRLSLPCEEDCTGYPWAVAELDFDWDASSGEICSFGTHSRRPMSGVAFRPDVGSEWLDLPAGRARRLAFHPDDWLTVSYLFERGANVYDISCYATEPPEDLWLAVAASFEFLGDDPHIVAVRSGVTMTFPIEWNVHEVRGQLAGAPGWEKMLWAHDGASVCAVGYDTRETDAGSDRTPGHLYAEYLDYLQLSATRSVEPITVDLPVGPAWRGNWSAGPEDHVVKHSLYQVPIGAMSLRVACLTYGDPPDDDWLSIAGSIDFEAEGE